MESIATLVGVLFVVQGGGGLINNLFGDSKSWSDELCPTAPASCRPFVDALRDAAISQTHAIFAGAAVCAFLAAILAVALLGRRGVMHT